MDEFKDLFNDVYKDNNLKLEFLYIGKNEEFEDELISFLKYKDVNLTKTKSNEGVAYQVIW